MSKKTNSWGIFIFSAAVLIVPILLFVGIKYPPGKYKAFYEVILPFLGIMFSLFAFLAGHFSYPRVQNLKVYLAGYLIGLAGLGYFIIPMLPHHSKNITPVLQLVNLLNFIIILTIPSYVKYRITKRITFSIVAFEGVLFAALYFVEKSTDWAVVLGRDGIFQVSFWIGLIWISAVIFLSVKFLKGEFYLGGIISGAALFYLIAWVAPCVFVPAHRLERILFSFAPAYLEIGILIHWFFRMEHRISYDPLLHIYNRNYCSKIIGEQSNINTAPPFGVAMIDIDHFKKVNDTHGHHAGDQVLYGVAQTILHEVVPEGIACRYGGEEIVVFFPKKKTREVVPVVENIRAAVESLKIQVKKKKLSVTVSCGVSHREDAGQSVMDAINAADKAMYRAKNGGRNRVKAARTQAVKQKRK